MALHPVIINYTVLCCSLQELGVFSEDLFKDENKTMRQILESLNLKLQDLHKEVDERKLQLAALHEEEMVMGHRLNFVFIYFLCFSIMHHVHYGCVA